MATRTKYDKILLEKIIKNDNCIINLIDYDDKLNIKTKINFICSCGNKYIKVFKSLNTSGGLCKLCSEKNRQQKITDTCFKKYGKKYALQSEQFYNKKKNTCLDKYGVEHASQLDIIKEKCKKICLEKYGVEHNSQTEESKNKIKETCLEKYGVEYILQNNEIKNKRKINSLIKYGVENPSQLEEIKRKMKETCLKKYGVESVSQVSEISEKIIKSSFKYKFYKFLDNTIIIIQGYENYAIDDLVKEGYSSKDIITSRSDVPKIWYEDSDGKKHRYFVDIYIPKINKMIEVKSSWTYKRYNKNINEKANECIKQGFDYQIWVYERNKTKKIIKFT